jgi:hypothetical protein
MPGSTIKWAVIETRPKVGSKIVAEFSKSECARLRAEDLEQKNGDFKYEFRPVRRPHAP